MKFIFSTSIACALLPNVFAKTKTPGTFKKGKAQKTGKSVGSHVPYVPYEIWASDQSNSVPGETERGVNGSFLWIFDDKAMKDQIEERIDAVPLPCTPGATEGPCNVHDMFPGDLINTKGTKLSELGKFGRLHAVVKDPFNRYVNANFFVPGGGYNGIIDTETKEAIALFRVTNFSYDTSTGAAENRSVHMSFWSADGSKLMFSNLHGKAIERVNVERDTDGKITSLVFDKSATLGLGRNMKVVEEATFFSGDNAYGNPLIGGVTGDYKLADLGNLTPNGFCKEDGCGFTATGRRNNVPICPIPSTRNNLYITLGGGGLFIANLMSTPMAIVGEYSSNIVNGAGLLAYQYKNEDQVFLNAGVSAGGAGFDQSAFTLYSFQDSAYQETPNLPNTPLPSRIFKDEMNTATIGNVDSGELRNDSGQIPGKTTRRDSHGAWFTGDGKYIHIVDRIQNNVESFNTETSERFTYDLVSHDGKSGRSGKAGACWTRSVTDDPMLPLNDPSPDLLEITPDGKYFVIALRGPVPVSVPHSAQGSCPGVAIVQISDDGKAGHLVDVIRTTNTVDTTPLTDFSGVGGHNYIGAERSDIHSAVVVGPPQIPIF